MNDNDALIDALRDLTSEIAKYRKVKERGLELAEEIENRRKNWVYEVH